MPVHMGVFVWFIKFHTYTGTYVFVYISYVYTYERLCIYLSITITFSIYATCEKKLTELCLSATMALGET